MCLNGKQYFYDETEMQKYIYGNTENQSKMTPDKATKHGGGILGEKENSEDTKLMNNLHQQHFSLH